MRNGALVWAVAIPQLLYRRGRGLGSLIRYGPNDGGASRQTGR